MLSLVLGCGHESLMLSSIVHNVTPGYSSSSLGIVLVNFVYYIIMRYIYFCRHSHSSYNLRYSDIV